MTRAGRLLFGIVVAITVALGAWRGSDQAAASSAVAPPIALRAAAPCVSQELQAGLAQQAAHHAGLVIVFPEGRIETRCMEFTGDTITGTELLQDSGLTIVFASFGGGLGAGVCRIDDVGCSDPGNCFCQCQSASCAFWSYFKLDGAVWRYESVGPATHRLHDGDTDAWVWGSGHAGPGDARAPCPTTPAPAVPTPTPAPPSDTPPPSQDGANGSSAATPAPRVESGATPLTARSTAGATATQTPPAQVAAAQRDGKANAASPSKSESGGGTPVGLIAFGVSVAALGAAIGGIFLRRRLGG